MKSCSFIRSWQGTFLDLLDYSLSSSWSSSSWTISHECTNRQFFQNKCIPIPVMEMYSYSWASNFNVFGFREKRLPPQLFNETTYDLSTSHIKHFWWCRGWGWLMLNHIEKFKVAVLYLNRDLNNWYSSNASLQVQLIYNVVCKGPLR